MIRTFSKSLLLPSLGVSNIAGTFDKMGREKKHSIPLFPILPMPMCSCLSIPLPRSAFESLRGSERDLLIQRFYQIHEPCFLLLLHSRFHSQKQKHGMYRNRFLFALVQLCL